VLADEGKVAAADAPVVQRLRAAGAVVVAKTNMTEFAFSGVGANPHFGTPRNPLNRACIPGGSTSGGAVAVGDQMCDIAIGSDTGGPTRIPAALCGIVGWKPSKQRVPTDGAFPLSFTLDSIGPMARSVQHCADADAVMAGVAPHPIRPAPLAGLRLGVPQGFPLDDLDRDVAAWWPKVIKQIEKAGVKLSDEAMPLFDDMTTLNAKGGFSPAEAFSIHRERLKVRADDVDPNVRFRIERGAGLAAADYVEMAQTRTQLLRAMDERLADLDALVLPTTPIVAPTIVEVADREIFGRKNMLLLRNTAWVNFFDLCAISLPVIEARPATVGLMLVARNGQDARLFRIAAAVEKLLAR
jgi:aspartyl-tRNA(Asn)/glutamyl-tRNA(Gln) amidotransferase subunit A